MIFETDLNVFGVVVIGDKTSRADGMLLKQNNLYTFQKLNNIHVLVTTRFHEYKFNVILL